MAGLIDESTSEYTLGVTEMDETHMEFIALVNQLVNANGEQFQQLFKQLAEHTEAHFDNENKLMESSYFPAMEEHKGEHARVLRDVKQFLVQVERGSTLMARAFIVEQVPDWFQLHATTMDAALAAHLNANQYE